MTRDYVSRTLQHMEWIRHDAMEAETKAARHRLNKEYRELWEAIRPYCEGTIPYQDCTPGLEPIGDKLRR